MIKRVWISADRMEIAWEENCLLVVYDNWTDRTSTPDRLEGDWIELPVPAND